MCIRRIVPTIVQLKAALEALVGRGSNVKMKWFDTGSFTIPQDMSVRSARVNNIDTRDLIIFRGDFFPVNLGSKAKETK